MDALHAIESMALDHVDGAPTADLLCLLADTLRRTKIVLAVARGRAGPKILNDAAYVEPELLAVVRENYTTPATNPLFEALPRFTPDRLFHFSNYTSWDAILGTPFYADY